MLARITRTVGSSSPVVLYENETSPLNLKSQNPGTLFPVRRFAGDGRSHKHHWSESTANSSFIAILC